MNANLGLYIASGVIGFMAGVNVSVIVWAFWPRFRPAPDPSTGVVTEVRA